MDKYEAQYAFWSSFGIQAYEENSVPDLDDVTFPYLTYEAISGLFDGDVAATASIWSRSASWLQADTLANIIEARLKDGGEVIRYDSGMIWVTAETPFSQNMGDPTDDRIRRKLLRVVWHFA